MVGSDNLLEGQSSLHSTDLPSNSWGGFLELVARSPRQLGGPPRSTDQCRVIRHHPDTFAINLETMHCSLVVLCLVWSVVAVEFVSFDWWAHGSVGEATWIHFIPWCEPWLNQCLGCLLSVFLHRWRGLVTWMSLGWVGRPWLGSPDAPFGPLVWPMLSLGFLLSGEALDQVWWSLDIDPGCSTLIRVARPPSMSNSSLVRVAIFWKT
jgi:hypothetical protein